MSNHHSKHVFGGQWTEEKLDCLRHYLNSYNTALKNTPFKRLYIDAFAGTGERYSRDGTAEKAQPALLEVTQAQAEFFEGSVRVALNADPSFDALHLIEASTAKCAQLARLKAEFPDRAINIYHGDANTQIAGICKSVDWHGRRTGVQHRAVLFLDPYGCQVKWETIRAIAATRAIDLWYLFPSGLGINRMAANRRERIPENWEPTLDACLGTGEWRTAFYQEHTTVNLFGEATTETHKVANIDHIEQFFLDRLKTVFSHVAPSCLTLSNGSGSKMFSLCFAANNPKGGPIALRIANHLLTKKRGSGGRR